MSSATKRLLLVAALALVVFTAIGALADATQNRPDQKPEEGSASAVTFDVDGRRFPRRADPGAALWAACQGTFYSETLDLAEVTDGTYRAVVQPALGEHARRRLTGCLNDATVDRVTGRVVAVEPLGA